MKVLPHPAILPHPSVVGAGQEKELVPQIACIARSAQQGFSAHCVSRYLFSPLRRSLSRGERYKLATQYEQEDEKEAQVKEKMMCGQICFQLSGVSYQGIVSLSRDAGLIVLGML